jgi:hypothetical protein
MQKVYLDTNAFVDLRKEEYAGLAKKLLDGKGQVLFFFSAAHIEDLRRDKTEHKSSDLAFIQEFADNNYLAIDLINKGCNVSKAAPQEVFDEAAISAVPPPPILTASSILTLRDHPLLKDHGSLFESIAIMLEKINDMPSTITPSRIYDHASQAAIEYLKRLGIEDRTYSALEWERIVSSMETLFNGEPELYRSGRRLAIDELGIQKAKASIDSSNFDENLSKSKIGQSFKDVVNAVLAPVREIPLFGHFFVEYTFSYFLLNLLGMDKEKNRSVRFPNVLVDAQHSFYGTNADFVVSSDQGFLSKTKVLYERYGIYTKVMSLDEFAVSIDLFDDSVLDPLQLFTLILHDLRYGFVVSTYDAIDTGMRVVNGRLTCRLFSYFNSFTMGLDVESTRVALYKQCGSIRQVQTFREIASVTNKAVAVLGSDLELQGDFSVDEESELSAGEWRGRRWLTAGIDTQLCIDTRTGELCLRITFPDSPT